MEGGRSRGSVSAHPCRSHLGMMAAAWKNPSYSIALPRKEELIFLSVWGFLQKEQNAFFTTDRSLCFSQASLTALTVQAAALYSPSSFHQRLPSEPHSLAMGFTPGLTALSSSDNNSAFPSPQDQDITSPPSSQSLTCPYKV